MKKKVFINRLLKVPAYAWKHLYWWKLHSHEKMSNYVHRKLFCFPASRYKLPLNTSIIFLHPSLSYECMVCMNFQKHNLSVLQILLPCPSSVTVYHLILLHRHRQSSIWAFLLPHKGVSVSKHNNYKIFLCLSDLYKEEINKTRTKNKETRKAST